MKIRILKPRGRDMAGMESRLLFTEFYKCRPVRVLSKLWGLFLFCLFFVFCGVMLLLLFWPQIKNVFSPARAERVKIAMHNQQQLAQIQKVHGAKNTRAIIYEADKAYFIGKDGRKVFIK